MDEEFLECIYVINKKAHEYSINSKNKREINKIKKNALYSLKSSCLRKVYDESNKIELHYINDNKYYCFYFENFVFHSPFEEHEIKDKNIKKEKEIKDFEKSYINHVNKTLRESLILLNRKYNLNANNYLYKKHLQTGEFTGWIYLY